VGNKVLIEKTECYYPDGLDFIITQNIITDSCGLLGCNIAYILMRENKFAAWNSVLMKGFKYHK